MALRTRSAEVCQKQEKVANRDEIIAINVWRTGVYIVIKEAASIIKSC